MMRRRVLLICGVTVLLIMACISVYVSADGLVDNSQLYNSARVSPNGYYFDMGSVTVSPSSGALLVVQTDFKLPGRNGLDFGLTRLYRSNITGFGRPGLSVECHWDEGAGYEVCELYAYVSDYQGAQPSNYLATGWTFNFPQIEGFDASEAFLFHEDGQIYKFIANPGYDAWTAQDYELYLGMFETGEGESYDNGYGETSRWMVEDGKGTTWYFNDTGNIIAKLDKYNNKIAWQYNSEDGKLMNIWDSVGRRIAFIWGEYDLQVSVYANASAQTPEYVWTYNLSETSHTGRKKLDSVAPPESSTALPTYYTYTEDNATFIGYSDTYGWSNEGQYTYLNLRTITNPAGGQTKIDYLVDNRDLDNDDITYDDSTNLQYYKVHKHWDEIVRTRATSSTTFVNEVQIAAVTEYTYGAWNGTYYSTNARVYDPAAPSVTLEEMNWRYDDEHESIYENTIGYNVGIDRQQTETIEKYDDVKYRELPIKSRVNTSIGGYNREEIYLKMYNDKKQLLYEVGPTGKIIERTYDSRYGMPLASYEQVEEGQQKWRITLNTLDGSGSVIAQTEQYVATRGTGNPISLPAGPTVSGNIPFNQPWTWTPEGVVSQVVLTIPWHYGMFYCTASYFYGYRSVFGGDWIETYVEHPGEFWAGGGTDIKTIDLPEPGWYTIRVRRYTEEVGLSGATATGQSNNWTQVPDTEKVKTTYEYDPTYYGNRTKERVYANDGVTIDTETNYAYDDTWHAWPKEQTTNVTQDGGTLTRIIKGTYDNLGRIRTYAAIDNSFIDDAQKLAATYEYTYDKLGRITQLRLPAQYVEGTRPTRLWAYSPTNRKITYTDERGVTTEVIYDGLGRITVEKQPNDASKLLLQTLYDILGRKAYDYDGLFHQTAYQYDIFGRKTKTIFADSTEQESWYVNTSSTPSAYPTLVLTPPPGFQGSTWVRWEKHEDEENRPAFQGYDVLNRLIWSASNPRSSGYPNNPWEITWYEYDALNRVLAIYNRRTDNTWEKTAFTYGLFDQPITMDLPGDTESIHTYSYNSRGLKVSEDAAIYWQYDQLGRPTLVTYPDNYSTVFTYSKNGQLDKVRADVKQGQTVKNTVTSETNLRGLIKCEQWNIDGNDYSLSYVYDDAGNNTRINYPGDNRYTEYQYNNKSLIDTVGSDVGYIARNGSSSGMIYKDNGLLESMITTNAVKTDYTYDNRNRLTNIFSDALRMSYTYTPSGNVQTITETPLNATVGSGHINYESKTYDPASSGYVLPEQSGPAYWQSNAGIDRRGLSEASRYYSDMGYRVNKKEFTRLLPNTIYVFGAWIKDNLGTAYPNNSMRIGGMVIYPSDTWQFYSADICSDQNGTLRVGFGTWTDWGIDALITEVSLLQKDNMVNNFSESGSMNNWSAYGGSGTADLVNQIYKNGQLVKTLAVTTSNDYMYWSDLVEIDPASNYEAGISVYSAYSDDRGSRWFGVFAYDQAMNPVYVSTFQGWNRTWGASTQTAYFWNGDVYGGNWIDLSAYIIGCHTPESAIPTTNINAFKLPNSARYIRLLFINFGNSGVSVRNDFYAPSVRKIDNLSLVNNYSSSGSAAGWTVTGGGQLALATEIPKNGIEVTTMKSEGSGNYEYKSDYIEINPHRDYEVRLSIYSAYPNDAGTRYFGIDVYDENKNYINVSTWDVATRQWLDGAWQNGNPYFWYGDLYGGQWRDMVGYIVGCDTASADIPDGLNVFWQYKLPSNAKYVRVRFLNYYNDGQTVRNDFYAPTLVQTNLAGRVQSYTYDGANRLLTAQVRRSDLTQTVTYQYDLAGNRTSEVWSDEPDYTYTYIDGNYLTYRGNVPYTWGSFGQLEAKDDVDYIYDERRLLAQVYGGSTERGSYEYDAYGRRIKKVEGGVTTINLYSGDDVVYEQSTRDSVTTNKRYVFAGGRAIAELVQENGGAWVKHFLYTDLVGSVKTIADDAGHTVGWLDYQPFGSVMQAGGTEAGEGHRFTGKTQDLTGLYYYGARFYDPEIGRFISVDPARQGLNWYVYCANNPVKYIDKDGKWFGVDDFFTGPIDEIVVLGGLAALSYLGVKWADDINKTLKSKISSPFSHSTPANPDPNTPDPKKEPKEYKHYSAKQIENKYKIDDFHEVKQDVLKDLAAKDSPYKNQMKQVGNNPDIHLADDGTMKIVSQNGKYSFETDWNIMDYL